MSELEQRIEALDPTLFDRVPSLTNVWDRIALLSIHAAVAKALGHFSYLEIGSYHGGSLQVVMCDPRCTHVISIDPRPAQLSDKRSESWSSERRSGSWMYEDNTTETMLGLLRALPSADLVKLTTFELGTDQLRPTELPVKPHYCFIDGEHTDDAALRDARFCLDTIDGAGVIAFHDSLLVKPAITAFLMNAWQDVSYALNFGSSVFAVEFGALGILTQPVVQRAIGSSWHRMVWQATNRYRRSSVPFRLAWSTIPAVDVAVLRTRQALDRALMSRRRP